MCLPAAATAAMRFAGAGFVAPVVLIILLDRFNSRAGKLAHAAIFGVLTCLPIAIWLRHTAAACGGNPAHRTFLVHPPNLEFCLNPFLGASRFLFPQTPLILRAALLLIAALWVGLRLRQMGLSAARGWPTLDTPRRPVLCCWRRGTCFSSSPPKHFSIPPSGWRNDSLSPFVLLCALGACCALAGRVLPPQPRWLAYCGAAIVATMLCLNIVDFARCSSESRNPNEYPGLNRLGYAGAVWKESAAVQAAAALPADVTIYSNLPDPIEFLTRRPRHILPERILPMAGLPNKDLESELVRIHHDLLAHKTVVFYFTRGHYREYLVQLPDLKQAWADVPRVQLTDCLVFGL